MTGPEKWQFNIDAINLILSGILVCIAIATLICTLRTFYENRNFQSGQKKRQALSDFKKLNMAGNIEFEEGIIHLRQLMVSKVFLRNSKEPTSLVDLYSRYEVYELGNQFGIKNLIHNSREVASSTNVDELELRLHRDIERSL
ncbi:hypothetical protein DXV75_12630 [Alteromonas aestuariivivens]|uniref:Uncharacterized protein n=1 Tax=Alteromonas aestuariivivens TaxID=1938339 RepID=A0A3D8M5H2_9ALTE|nr:hypothetical protein [Alteromonas aestuariivivens]RDV24906.1 hypothetical protein DXV75_12630 [Alteromonas aestuariivivens]